VSEIENPPEQRQPQFNPISGESNANQYPPPLTNHLPRKPDSDLEWSGFCKILGLYAILSPNQNKTQNIKSQNVGGFNLFLFISQALSRSKAT
jgi:hypothetical protein